jgi:hypothetical protein
MDMRASAMTLQDRIENAFKHRSMPDRTVATKSGLTPDVLEATWFAGRDWHDLSQRDWELHRDAIYHFTVEAFQYYLPSILLLTADGQRYLFVADGIISCLDRSPTTAYWDEFLTSRFLGLADQEYEVLKVWLLTLSGRSDGRTEDQLARAYETVELLQQETARLRSGLR